MYITLTPSTPTIHKNDIVAVGVYLNTEGKDINVVEGTLSMPVGGTLVEMRDVSVAGSELSYWVRKPSWSPTAKTITFTGGAPTGFSGPNGLLFTMFFKVNNAGTLTFKPTLSAYAHDGKGTSVPVKEVVTSFSVGRATAEPHNAERDIVAQDNTPPVFTTADIGQDPSLFNGKVFLSVFATDAQSGIDYYEVTEGSFSAIRIGNTYVLRAQDRSLPVTVVAHDKAGNVASTILPPNVIVKNPLSFVYIVIGIIVVAGLSLLLKRRAKK